jgi:hypothetical protein
MIGPKQLNGRSQMNLRLGNGLVPVRGDGDPPYTFLPFPSKTAFVDLYSRRFEKENLFKYWEILRARTQGATLKEAGEPFGISRERVRQIEAKFLRLFREHHRG